MNEDKWEDILNTLVENKYTYHEIEKGAGISNGTFGKLKSGAMKRLSDSNYEKLKKFFIGAHLGIKAASVEEIPEVAALRAENAALKAEIARLKPLADALTLRSAQQQEAAENGPEMEITTISNKGRKKSVLKPLSHTTKFDESGNIIEDLKVQQLPQNIEQLKAICPKELTGIDKTIWLSEERKKYNL